MENNLHFDNGKFKIMQIADIQENARLNPDTVKLIDLALEKEKPDLVVFTGDQIQGYSASYEKDTEKRVEGCISAFLEPLIKRGIPFTYTFGNHDDDCSVSKSRQAEIYASKPGCIMGPARCEEDPGTHCITVKDSSDEKDLLALYLIDSNKKEANGSYSPVKPEQIQWYKDTRDAFFQRDGAYLPGIVFQHIPLCEFYDILKKVNFFTRGRVEAYHDRKNTFYKLSDTAYSNGGFLGESPAVPGVNTGEFDALKEKGDIFAFYVGHDHVNSFVENYQGIDLGYTQGAGFNTYGPGSQRGVRIFELTEDDVRNYSTYTVTMSLLCGGKYKPAYPLKEFVFSHAPTCVEQVKTDLTRAGALLLTAGAIYAVIRKFSK